MAYPRVDSSWLGDRFSSRLIRIVIATLGLICLLWGAWTARGAGLARLAVVYVVNSGSLGWAETAVSLSPADPEAAYIRAEVFYNNKQFALSVKEFERAIALRPRDYFLWLGLGRARDEAGDKQGALAAFGEAARLAPYYVEPPWQLGNFLLRMGRRDEAFAQLRRAAARNAKLLPSIIDSAWKAYSGDVQAVKAAVQPQTTEAHLTLARFFLGQDNLKETIAMYRLAGSAAAQDRRDLIADQLANKMFDQAYEVWLSGRGEEDSDPRRSGKVGVTDGSFEGRIELDDPGFGWRLAPDVGAVEVALDPNTPRTGARSLRINWSGDSNPSISIGSQLVLVDAKTRYRLSFAARTEELVTGGSPVVIVTDVSSDERELAQAATLPTGSSGWQDYTVEFVTAEATRAVRITIRRQDCSSGPCPIFGRTWFDDFSLRKL